MEHLVVPIADPRVDLETSDEDGRSLEEVARWDFSFLKLGLVSNVFFLHISVVIFKTFRKIFPKIFNKIMDEKRRR